MQPVISFNSSLVKIDFVSERYIDRVSEFMRSEQAIHKSIQK